MSQVFFFSSKVFVFLSSFRSGLIAKFLVQLFLPAHALPPSCDGICPICRASHNHSCQDKLSVSTSGHSRIYKQHIGSLRSQKTLKTFSQGSQGFLVSHIRVLSVHRLVPSFSGVSSRAKYHVYTFSGLRGFFFADSLQLVFFQRGSGVAVCHFLWHLGDVVILLYKDGCLGRLQESI